MHSMLVSVMSMPFPEKTLAEYLEACRKCERKLVLTPAQIKAVRPHLTFERTGTARGRHLKQAVPTLGLEAKDRLVCTTSHPSVADFAPENGPRPCTFWRPSLDTLARARNPLICEETGITMRSFGIDWMHCLSLGIFAHLLGYLLRALLDLDVWRVRSSKQQIAEVSMGYVRAMLVDWYKKEASTGRKHSEVRVITVKMLGVPNAPFLKVNAGECNGFLRFAQQELLPRFGFIFGPRLQPFTVAIDTLVVMLVTCWEYKRKIPPVAVQAFSDAVVNHMKALKTLNIPNRPKHHQAMELSVRLSVYGTDRHKLYMLYYTHTGSV